METTEFKGGLDHVQQHKEDKDPRNYALDGILGGLFGAYTPKYTEREIETFEIVNQGPINICVVASIVAIKERQEGVKLSLAFMTALAVREGVMNENGTSIQAILKLGIKYGFAEEAVCPSGDPNDFATFSHPSKLTPEAFENAAKHTIDSYWSTRSLNTILQQIDNGKNGEEYGAGGVMWYTGYNELGGLVSPWIIEPKDGVLVFGHALLEIKGYNLNYYGHRVIKIQNSYGKDWGDNGCFYVKFEDWDKFQDYNVYYFLDIKPDIASWLSLHAGKLMKKPFDPADPTNAERAKIYKFEGNTKRHIRDEAVFLLSRLSFLDVEEDHENMLDLIPEGKEITIDDVPPIDVENFKKTLQIMKNSELMQRVFHPYFPDIV